jgi:hypothetical protein
LAPNNLAASCPIISEFESKFVTLDSTVGANLLKIFNNNSEEAVGAALPPALCCCFVVPARSLDAILRPWRCHPVGSNSPLDLAAPAPGQHFH